MKNSSAILINLRGFNSPQLAAGQFIHAENCLHQMAQGADDPLSAVLTAADQTVLQNKRLKTRNDAYYKARKRMVESEVKSLFQLSGQRLDEVSPKAWLWHGRRVVLTDGSTLSMPDSQDNQAVYPQPSTPKKNSVFRS